jgi:uncharacterized protein
MLQYVLICSVALIASGLTFFSGFGLGTLLLPAFAVFVPVEIAVALTAIVHFLNGLFKLVLVGRHANLGVAMRFGLPAVVAAFLGARVLAWFSDLPALLRYDLGGRTFSVMPIKLLLAILMIAFAGFELSRRFKDVSVRPQYLPLGGLVTGFFGGLSGHQGAFRSAFLIRLGLPKESFIATGVAISAAIDVSRITAYLGRIASAPVAENASVLVAATSAAFLCASRCRCRWANACSLRTSRASAGATLASPCRSICRIETSLSSRAATIWPSGSGDLRTAPERCSSGVSPPCSWLVRCTTAPETSRDDLAI